MATRMLQRRGTTAEWASANPVLSDGEIGYDRDTKTLKVGDGVTAWADLRTTWVDQSIVDAVGDLIVGSGPDAVVKLPVGTTGQRLTAQADGTLAWQSPSVDIPASIEDVKGDLIVGTGADTFTRLPVGTNGKMLVADSSQTSGLAWSNTIQPDVIGSIGLIVKGLTGQTAAIQEWRNGAGVPKFTVDANGNVQWGVFTNANQGPAHVNIGNAVGDVGSIPLAVRGATGQTANIQEWQSPTAVLAAIGNNGSGDKVSQIRKGTSTIAHTGGNRFINTDIPIQAGDILQIYILDQYANAVQLKWWSTASTTVYVGDDANAAQTVKGNSTVADGTTVYWTLVRST